MRKTLLAVLVSGLMVSGAQAADFQVNGYLFGNVGQANYDLDGVTSGRSGSGDDTDTAFKVGAGVQLNQYFAVELQYLDLGDVDYDRKAAFGRDSLFGQSVDDNFLKVASETAGFGANVVGMLPFKYFKLFGKLGYHRLQTNVKERHVFCQGQGTWCVSENDTTEWVTSYGIGASYAFAPQIELAAEFERYQDVADEYDVDMASIGLRYNF